MASSVAKWAAVLLIASILTPGDSLIMPGIAGRHGQVSSLKSSVRSLGLRNAIKMSLSRREAIATAFTAAITLIPAAFPSAVGFKDSMERDGDLTFLK